MAAASRPARGCHAAGARHSCYADSGAVAPVADTSGAGVAGTAAPPHDLRPGGRRIVLLLALQRSRERTLKRLRPLDLHKCINPMRLCSGIERVLSRPKKEQSVGRASAGRLFKAHTSYLHVDLCYQSTQCHEKTSHFRVRPVSKRDQ